MQTQLWYTSSPPLPHERTREQHSAADLLTSSPLLSPLLQPVVMCGFQELTGSLQDLLTQATEHIKGQETVMTALKLASLTLEGFPQVSVCFCERAGWFDMLQKSLFSLFSGNFGFYPQNSADSLHLKTCF